MSKSSSGFIAAGLALFSMFFGAGSMMWPLILGGSVGQQNFYSLLGLLITGVSLPLLGLIAMILFQGDYHTFFGKIGKWPSLILIFIIQIILGPLGSIPRLVTLSYSTVKAYFPFEISLFIFSIIACIVILLFTSKPQKLVSLLGNILTPILLLSIGLIFIFGFWGHPEQQILPLSSQEAFSQGLKVGYNTLDLIASFIFAPLVLSHFVLEAGNENDQKGCIKILKKMLKASMLAAALLSIMYIGLTYLSSYYTPLLEELHKPEERLSLIAKHLFGEKGALLASLAISLTCLTTAIPLVSIFAKYLRNELFLGKVNLFWAQISTLLISCGIANLGFMGIANMLSPILQILCPALIVLCIMNIANKLYETKVSKIPVFATFAISTIGHFI